MILNQYLILKKLYLIFFVKLKKKIKIIKNMRFFLYFSFKFFFLKKIACSFCQLYFPLYFNLKLYIIIHVLFLEFEKENR